MTQPPAIVFDAVRKTFGEGRQVLDGVSLAVPAGEFVAVVGASGAGKTTLLRLINRLADASAGAVRVDGEDVVGVEVVPLNVQRQCRPRRRPLRFRVADRRILDHAVG